MPIHGVTSDDKQPGALSLPTASMHSTVSGREPEGLRQSPSDALQHVLSAPTPLAAALLTLQQSVGNRAAQRIVGAKRQPAPHRPLPAQLTVGPVDAPGEREADRVAKQISHPSSAHSANRSIMQGGHGPRPTAGHPVAPEIAAALARARRGGQPLPDTVRTQMESGLGADLGGVKLHTGAEADRLNRALHARAFTLGHDVFFRYGAFAPGSATGQEVIAHELTHVAQQQTPAAQPVIQRMTIADVDTRPEGSDPEGQAEVADTILALLIDRGLVRRDDVTREAFFALHHSDSHFDTYEDLVQAINAAVEAIPRPDYMSAVQQLRENLPPDAEVPTALRPLFYPDTSESHLHEERDPSGQLSDEWEGDDEASLLSKDDRRTRKDQAFLAKRQSKRLNKEAKKITKEEARMQPKPGRYEQLYSYDDESESVRENKSLPRRLLSGATKLKRVATLPYRQVKKEWRRHRQFQPKSERSHARAHWYELELAAVEDLLNQWEADLGVDRATAMEFLMRQYPDFAAYLRGVLDIGKNEPVKTATSRVKGQPGSHTALVQEAMQSGLSTARSGRLFGTLPAAGESWVSPLEPSTLDPQVGIGSVVGLTEQGATVVNTLSSLHEARKGLESTEAQLQSGDVPLQDRQALLLQMAEHRKQQRQGVRTLAETGGTGAMTVTNLGLLAGGAGSGVPVVSALGLPLALYQTTRQGRALEKSRVAKNTVKAARSQVDPDTEETLRAAEARMQLSRRDKKMGLGSSVATTAIATAGTGLGLATLAVGSVFSAGGVVAAVGLLGGAAVLAYHIKQRVSAHQRGVKHEKLHASFQEQLNRDDPDLHAANETAREIRASDPRVTAHSLYNALLNSSGDQRKVIVEVIEAYNVPRNLDIELR